MREKNRKTFQDDLSSYEDEIDRMLAEEDKNMEETENAEKKSMVSSLIAGLVIAAALVIVVASFALANAGKLPVRLPGRKQGEDKARTVKTESDGSIVVPDIVGMQEKDAQKILQDAGLGVKVAEQKTDASKYGTVLSQFPENGAKIKKNSAVSITTSLGAKSVKIPSTLYGQSEDDACHALEEEGFSSIKTRKVKSSRDIGTVVSVSPDAGETTYTDKEVTLSVSCGEGKNTTAGNYLNYTEDDAKYLAQKDGLVPRILYGSSDVEAEGAVMSQSVEPGGSVAQGTDIVLTVNSPDIKSKGDRNGWTAKIRMADKPFSYKGGPYQLILVQYEDGILFKHSLKSEKKLTFPVQTVITGIENVESGTIYLYEKDGDSYVRRGKWDVQFHAK